MIDWQMITNGYNLTHGRKFKTFDMLEYLYSHIGNVEKVADYLGVSATALCRRMDKLNVPRIRKSAWPGSITYKIAGIPAAKLRKMTAHDVAALCDCHVGSVYRALDYDGRTYKMRS